VERVVEVSKRRVKNAVSFDGPKPTV
jgi:hypothetical protein